MEEITVENIKELYEPLRNTFLHWAQINESIIKFQKNANMSTFETIFKEDAERLIRHFKYDCDSRFDKFKTYLTQEQINLLLMNLHINKDYIY